MNRHLVLWLAALLLSFTAGYAHQISGADIATLTQLQVDHGSISGVYEVHFGELAALNERQQMDTDGDRRVSAAEQQAYIARMRERLNANLSMKVDDQSLPVRLERGELLPDDPLVAPVQLTLRFQLAPQRADFNQRRILFFRDANQFARLVHADIEIEGQPLVDIEQLVAKQGALKRILVEAPEGRVEATVEMKPAEYLWQSAPFAGSQELFGGSRSAEPSFASTTDRLKGMLHSQQLSVGLIVFSLGIAIFLGAVHSLEPGHGKALVAAYLIGERGTVSQAILLGSVVTFTHTFSVVLLGVITLFASRYILPEQLFPWLGSTSGLLVMGVGIWLFVRHLTGKGHGHSHGPGGHQHYPMAEAGHDPRHDHVHDHEHSHGHGDEHAHEHPHPHPHENDHLHDHGHPHSHGEDHDHEHPHEHGDEHAPDHPPARGEDHDHPHPHEAEHAHAHEPGDEHAHDHPHPHDRGPDHEPSHDHEAMPRPAAHAPTSAKRVTLKSLLALGIAGGIVPCPSALVILLLAVALQRILFGLTLIVAFSLGLATVLIVIGVLTVKARPLVERFSGEGRLLRLLPVVSSVAITGLGFLMIVRTLMEAGIVIIRL
jgi:nickel/cobalt transporter (NicO) family protein